MVDGLAADQSTGNWHVFRSVSGGDPANPALMN
jgi:hypothetical protein